MTDFEREDMELQFVMGSKFIDETKPMTEAKHEPAAKEEKPKKAKDAEWHPVKERNWMDDLTDCAKSTLIFGGLSLLVWYWEISGLMDESIALPCMLVCAALAGLGIGKALGGK